MSAAELPEPVPRDSGEAAGEVPERAAVSRSDGQASGIDQLQLRLDELRARIKASLPEGYDLGELIKASGEGHESEEVFEITGEFAALERLAGPLMVPGMSPQPAFDSDSRGESSDEEAGERIEGDRRIRWGWLSLLVVIVLAIAAGVYVFWFGA